MPYEITWTVPERVVFLRAYGDIALPDIKAINRTLIEHLGSGQAPMFLIVETSGIGEVPRSLRELSDANAYLHHPSLKRVFIINQSMIISFMASVVAQLARMKLVTVKSMAEVEDYLVTKELLVIAH